MQQYMYRFPFAGRYAVRFWAVRSYRLNFFNGWWAVRFFQAAQNVIGFYLASPQRAK